MSFQVSHTSFMPAQRTKTPVFAGSKQPADAGTTSGTSAEDVASWLLSGNKTVRQEGKKGFFILSTDGQASVIINIIKPGTQTGKAFLDGAETAKSLVLAVPTDRQVDLLKQLYASNRTLELKSLLFSLRGNTNLEVIGQLAKTATPDDVDDLSDLLYEEIRKQAGTDTQATLHQFVTRFPSAQTQQIAARAFSYLESTSDQVKSLVPMLTGGRKTASIVTQILETLSPEHNPKGAQEVLLDTARFCAQQMQNLEAEVTRLKRELGSAINRSVPAGYDVNEHRKVRD